MGWKLFVLGGCLAALAACEQESAAPAPINAPMQQAAQDPAPQAMLSAEQREELEGLVLSYLDTVQETFAQGWSAAPGLATFITSLQPGRDDRWQVALQGGTAYRMIGACDNECENIDFELIDSSGGVVAGDLAPDDAPIVNFTPALDGVYTLRIMMQSCSIAPCFAGARVLAVAPS